MKKILHICLIVLCVVSFSGCSKGSDRKDLIVASYKHSGYFIQSDGLSNTVEDMNVRDLIHGGGLIRVDDEGAMQVDESVVKEYAREEDSEGNVVYTFTLKDRLWSDGKPICADDYLFSLLLAASPAFAEAQAMDVSGEGLLGYWDYYETGEVFSGIKKLDDTSFSLTIDATELPYFWELIFMGIVPYPMHALTQNGETIISNDMGTSFQGDMSKAVDTYITTYNATLNPSCGPYRFVSYENGQVTLTRNEQYAGDFEGNKPSIENIIMKEMYEETSVDALIAGEIDILEPVMEVSIITKGKEEAEKGNLQFASFERNGYGILALKNDTGPTKEVEVRRAIAYLLDRETLVKDIIGGYGNVIDSDYANTQWMYDEAKDELNLPYSYALSIKKANEQLASSLYRFEADGVTPWDERKVTDGYYRYNAEGEELNISHLAIDNNTVSDAIEQQLVKNAIQAGIHYTITRTDEAGMSEAYYFLNEQAEEDKRYNAFSIGSQFGTAPDPYYVSFACEYANSSANPMNICDPKLDELMTSMRHRDAKDTKGYLEAWIAYEQYFNETLPQIPLYTSEYYGFAHKDLKGYEPNSYLGWAQQITRLSWK